ncbi:Avr4 [Fulvia fulva]|uniref:Race-specific elicitor A4 n=3 Tax=Passalora fulva TaxID=5499 RepID=AVR4_PASFU|nr:Avr4 [Fulvia fulva]Q00363.1 RecName: Full=Race-specific elicitor A4; Flags: Precursor [Fulvia fulva]AGD98909.1 AVR4 protein [Fulvia fulva]AGD98910.1 AVR4 protein [Fulvia fulva]AGD98911.1 AVR4 protein [Fulvia fulva]AGD98912.1 AVR4 protein [Fulvia fulva]AGD98913.1 AVR4 protein [Fulvia fulva]
MHYTTLLLSTLLVGTALAQPTNPPAKTPKKAPKTQPYNPCKPQEVIDTKCMGPKDCLYPNPDSCTTYIQCVPLDEVGNAKPVVKPCPKGLQWNDNVGKKWCDYPNLSTCPVKTPQPKPKKGGVGGKKASVGHPGY